MTYSKWPIRIYCSETTPTFKKNSDFITVLNTYVYQKVAAGMMAVKWPGNSVQRPTTPVLAVPSSDGGGTVWCFNNVEAAQSFLSFIESHVPDQDMSAFSIETVA